MIKIFKEDADIDLNKMFDEQLAIEWSNLSCILKSDPNDLDPVDIKTKYAELEPKLSFETYLLLGDIYKFMANQKNVKDELAEKVKDLESRILFLQGELECAKKDRDYWSFKFLSLEKEKEDQGKAYVKYEWKYGRESRTDGKEC